MSAKFSALQSKPFLYSLLVFLVLLVGLGVRLHKFPDIPPGLNIDEAVCAYEAYSLLETGNDKWGHQLPAYFPGWGSGQNVLLSYLSVPFIQLFGLSIFSARITALLFGCLTLPLFYFCLRPFGKFGALLGLLLLSLVPWHFMLSRWALESNLLPFCMLLGCTLLTKALISQKKRWIVPSLLPFGLALYAYGTTVMVLPFFFGFMLFFFWRNFKLQLGAWLTAVSLLLVLAFPFLIFFLENHVLKTNLPWTDRLFFSTNLLPSSRLNQINEGGWLEVIRKNYDFLKSGFDDHSVYNLMPGKKLLLPFTVSLAIIGLVFGGFKILIFRKDAVLKPEIVVLATFIAWALASVSLFLSFELNVNRFNHFYIPALALAVWLLSQLVKIGKAKTTRFYLQALVFCGLTFIGGKAVYHYFHKYQESGIRGDFNEGLDDAFAAVKQLPVDQVYITKDFALNLTYMYALFYLQYPPEEFQKTGQFAIRNGVYKVYKFGNYILEDSVLNHDKPYGYLFRRSGPESTKDRGNCTTTFQNELWEVGICRPK